MLSSPSKKNHGFSIGLRLRTICSSRAGVLPSAHIMATFLPLRATFLKRQAAHKLSVASVHACITYRRGNVTHTLCIPWVACARIPPNDTHRSNSQQEQHANHFQYFLHVLLCFDGAKVLLCICMKETLSASCMK